MPAELTPAALGFAGSEAAGWSRVVRGMPVEVRILRTLDDLAHAEQLQFEVLGVTERDLIPANELIVIAETGGAVFGAFAADEPETALAVLVGWGGYVYRPRLVSDFLAVRPEARNLGLAAELKRLQAAVARQRGFAEIVWTVDPLRAANARLNFAKLGATADAYEIDRYGAGFATGLYGGMPTDRIHVTWEITAPEVVDRILGIAAPPALSGEGIAPFAPGTTASAATVAIPADIDALLGSNPDEAMAWRHQVRDLLPAAFGEGFAITGFIPAQGEEAPYLYLERSRAPSRPTG